jgi:hypothetical protein
MDDARIRQLSEEVLGNLRRGGTTEGRSLESRVAALETAVARLAAGGGSGQGTFTVIPASNVGACVDTPSPSHTHPSLQLVKVTGSTTGRCVLEPDKPCNNSGTCRSFGY